jgi:glucose-6-phosphate dehydrogenase assembly protein OpcA
MPVVAPAQIQAELNKIWDSLEASSKMRACLFNLICYTHKTHRAGYIHKIAQKVIEKFPSRVILVTVDKDASEKYLKTAVSVLSAGEIACDLIEIEVSGSAQDRIPFVILPHILPDLPVYLVWAEDPTQDNKTSHQLEQFASRLIVDSESTDNLPRFAEALLKHSEQPNLDIADLNWARLESWRDLFSATFYSEERLAALKSASDIQIHYNAEESTFFCHTRIQSIYLQAWLACQLGWELKEVRPEKEVLSFFYQSESRPITIQLHAERHSHLPPGTVISVNLTTQNEQHFYFTRNLKSPHQITMKLSTPIKCEIPTEFIFAKSESGQSLVKEICHKGTSSHYLKVLNLVKSMDVLSC